MDFEIDRYRFRGIVDLIEETSPGQYVITDYKTTRQGLSFMHWLLRLPIRADRQMVFYRLGVENTYSDAQRIDLQWYFAKWGATVRARCNAQIIERVKREAVAAVERIYARRR